MEIAEVIEQVKRDGRGEDGEYNFVSEDDYLLYVGGSYREQVQAQNKLFTYITALVRELGMKLLTSNFYDYNNADGVFLSSHSGYFYEDEFREEHPEIMDLREEEGEDDIVIFDEKQGNIFNQNCEEYNDLRQEATENWIADTNFWTNSSVVERIKDWEVYDDDDNQRLSEALYNNDMVDKEFDFPARV